MCFWFNNVDSEDILKPVAFHEHNIWVCNTEGSQLLANQYNSGRSIISDPALNLLKFVTIKSDFVPVFLSQANKSYSISKSSLSQFKSEVSADLKSYH